MKKKIKAFLRYKPFSLYDIGDLIASTLSALAGSFSGLLLYRLFYC